MTRNPISLHAEASMRDALALFNTHEISCIPIVDNHHHPIGILSWRDVLRAVASLPGDI
jgi:acetoin utilization protein AcuB